MKRLNVYSENQIPKPDCIWGIFQQDQLSCGNVYMLQDLAKLCSVSSFINNSDMYVDLTCDPGAEFPMILWFMQ